jgi:hypothetical protein
VLGSSESRWKAFILTVGEGSERIFSLEKFSHYLSFVRSLVHPKRANFWKRAEERMSVGPKSTTQVNGRGGGGLSLPCSWAREIMLLNLTTSDIGHSF